MSFPISAALLDAIVLSVVAQEPEGTYGYRITQQVTHTLELSESTLYPVLRRLQKDQLLTVYDAPAVSYTHLDVYKRQGGGPGRCTGTPHRPTTACRCRRRRPPRGCCATGIRLSLIHI